MEVDFSEVILPNYREACLVASGNNYGLYYKTYNNQSNYHYQPLKLNENHFVKSDREYDTSINLSTGYTCLAQGDLVYKPELKVYFTLASIAVLTLIFVVIYKIIIKRLLP